MWFLFACSGLTPAPTAGPGGSAEAGSAEAGSTEAGSTAPVAPPSASPVGRLVPAEPLSQDHGVSLTAALEIGGQRRPLAWTTLLVEGQAYGGPPFGTLVDAAGDPLSEGDPPTCGAPDFTAIFPDSRTMLTHLECSPAAIYQSTLAPGALTVSRSAPIDAAAVGGLNVLCSGTVTDWGTLLSGEEFETDVGYIQDGKIPSKIAGKADDNPYMDWSLLPERSRFAPGVSPYRSGMMIETTPGPGKATVVRRAAMGRFSHELGVVMPDQKTVYLSDDNLHGGLFMFIADKPGDLSAGRLYAARIVGQDTWALTWVDLGAAAEGEILAAIDVGVTFEQMFSRTAPPCAPGTVAWRAPQSVDECLSLVPGADRLASRLETRRYAAFLGATLELEKTEGLALDADRRQLYLAVTRVKSGMLAGDPPAPMTDTLAMTENRCGVVMGLTLGGPANDTRGAPIPSEWVANTATVAIRGVPEGEGCAMSGISNPDNLAWADPLDTLLIAEDTDRSPNRLWAWRDGALIPIFAAPDEAHPGEVSGLSYVPSLDGAGYITVSVQNPGKSPAFMGLIGPIGP